MRISYTTALVCSVLLCLFATPTFGQNSACFGESVTLQLDATRGSLQWQKSLDGQNYSDLVGQTAISTQQVITEDAWFRAYHITETGCDTVWSDVFAIEVNDLRADAGSDQVICEFESLTLGGNPSAIGGFAPHTYAWSPSTDLTNATLANPVATPSATRDYILTVNDANGCTAVDTMNVLVNVITTDSVTFNATGGPQTFVVPPCITMIRVRLWGAQGSPGTGTTAGVGGRGGFVDGLLSVSPGDVITVQVGTQGGYNGGGLGGTSSIHPGGHGGGASDIRLNGSATANIVAIAAGGGGGGGGGGFVSGNGGNGGANNGNTGANGTSAGTPGGTAGLLGTGATLFAGGTGGTGGTGCGFFNAGPGQNGTPFQGGNGGNTTTGGTCTFPGAGGGGGGGGVWGGAGGGGGAPGDAVNFTGAGGGGGAGSSSTGTLTSATTSGTTRTGDGLIIINW